MRKKKNSIQSIDLHGIRHKEALELVHKTLNECSEKGSFSLTIITGNSTVLQERIFTEYLENSIFTYFIPSWNMGQIIVENIVL
tara:strand:- start:254 stop:505 length:252 start_codon:yes stop_codon:yes gene_type:complete